MLNGALNMKHLCKALLGAALAFALAGISSPTPTFAEGGSTWDPVCNCRRPDHEYQTRRVVRGAPEVRTQRRVVTHRRVVAGKTRLIQENRLIVHVKPVINREVVEHRTHTVVRNVVLHKTNTTNKYRTEQRRQVVNVNGGNTTQHVTVHRRVRGVNCNCPDDNYRTSSYDGGYRGGRVVSYRD